MKRSIQLVALLLTVFMGSCTGGKDKAAAEHVDAKPIVKLADVKARPVDQIQDYTATVEAEVKNNIAPSSPVRIDQIFVEVGDRVSKGQKLVQMDAANLKQTKLQLDNQEIEFNRIDELYKVGGASKSEWDASKMQLDVKKTAYKNLLENTSLQSPINGVVTARNYDNGDMYSGGEPVLVVEQITPVKLLINVSETYFTKVKKGTPVDVKLDVYGDEVFTGTINLIYPTIDATTRTFQVEIRLDNKDQRVRPGMFARATLNFGTAENVVVPDLAIVKQAGSGDRYVFVYKDGKVSYNKVELGRRMGTEYELKSGVPDNSQVVVAGQSRLVNGMEVAVEEINAKGGLQIEFNAQDDEADGEKAVSAYNVLKDWGMQVMAGQVTTGSALAVAPESTADNMFNLTPSASAESLALSGANIFQMCFTDPNQGASAAELVSTKALGTKVGVIYDSSDDYSSGLYKGFSDKAAELGLEIVATTSFTADNKADLSTQVTQCQDAGADLVFLPIYYTEAAQILSYANKIGYAPKFFGCDGMDGILTVEGFDTSLAEGLALMTPFDANASDEATQSFVAKFKEKMDGLVPNQFAADGYDVIYALYNAMTAAGITGSESASEICTALEAQFATMTIDGLTGTGMHWDENGMISKAPAAVVIENGVYVPMG